MAYVATLQNFAIVKWDKLREFNNLAQNEKMNNSFIFWSKISLKWHK